MPGINCEPAVSRSSCLSFCHPERGAGGQARGLAIQASPSGLAERSCGGGCLPVLRVAQLTRPLACPPDPPARGDEGTSAVALTVRNRTSCLHDRSSREARSGRSATPPPPSDTFSAVERDYPRLVRELESWFEHNHRALPWRDGYDPYHVWVSEIMAQQTRMDVVLRYWPPFIDRFPTVESLAAADQERVLASWSGLGYYRRARMLREGARDVVERFGGVIPSDPTELQSIAGIGRYTAGAIASIAFDEAVPIVDGNILRLLARLEMLDEPLRSRGLENRCWTLAAELVELAASPRTLNQALMELGAAICTPRRPSCDDCPVSSHCAAAAAGREEDYPRAPVRQETIDLVVPVYLVTDAAGRVMLIRSSSGTMMNHMFRLPGRDEQIGAAVAIEGVRPLRHIGEVRHSITNRRVRFEVWDATIDTVCDTPGGDIRWVGRDELSSIPHPSWVRKAIELRGDDAE